MIMEEKEKKFMLHLTTQLHRRAKVVAAARGASMNQLITQLLEKELAEVKA
jgi:predicted HicB family RNase H-like nuclease